MVVLYIQTRGSERFPFLPGATTRIRIRIVGRVVRTPTALTAGRSVFLGVGRRPLNIYIQTAQMRNENAGDHGLSLGVSGHVRTLIRTLQSQHGQLSFDLEQFIPHILHVQFEIRAHVRDGIGDPFHIFGCEHSGWRGSFRLVTAGISVFQFLNHVLTLDLIRRFLLFGRVVMSATARRTETGVAGFFRRFIFEILEKSIFQ